MTTSIYGVGWSFPVRLDSTETRISMSSNETLIKESMRAILLTDVDERPHRVKNGVPFGTRIQRAVFENITIASDMCSNECKRALTVWEPRIIVREVIVSYDALRGVNRLGVNILFVYRKTNRSDNLVVQFRSTPDEVMT